MLPKLPPVAERVVCVPVQMIKLPVIVIFCAGRTITEARVDDLQPFRSVTETVYVVVMAGETVIELVVALLDQR